MLIEAVQNLVMYKLYQKDNEQDTTRVFIEIIRRGEARKEKELCKKISKYLRRQAVLLLLFGRDSREPSDNDCRD